ncbi:hypothetical protein [Aeromonas hydrophila]|uniref:hypothetical protein n=1 Tax=Aeromonas hydrophila TaxID=644 RepID=UPI003989E233
MNNKQTVSREEYRRLDNRVTCILQQRWPAHEIRQWVGMLKGKQQAVVCTILRRHHPSLASLTLPTITTEVPNPFQSDQAKSPIMPLLADSRSVGHPYIVGGLTSVTSKH